MRKDFKHMVRTREGRIPAEVMEGIRSLCKEREESFTDSVLLLMGLVNNVYERGEAVVYRVDFLPGRDGLERRVYASLSLENTDTAENALQKLTKSAAMPKDYGMGNEDGLYGLNVLAAKEADGGVSFVMSAEEERFSDAQLGTFINMLVNFAKQLAEEPDRPLCELERVNPEERLRIIEASRGPDLSFDTEKTWLDLFQENAEAFPDALAVSADNGTYTYGELDTLSDVLALALLEKGAKEGDFVVLKLDRVKEFMTAVVGIHKAGCAYIPVDPAYPEDRINFMIEDSCADIVLTEQDIVEILSSYEGGGVDAKKLPGAKPDGRAYMIYTSGSTGRPKGVMIAHRSLMNFTVSIRHLAGIRRGDRIIAHRSFSFDAHIEDYFPTLAAGAAVFIIGEDKRRDSDEIVAFMNENHLTGGGFTTSVARVLMTQYEMPMRYIIAGGEALYGITGKSSIQIINEYGPTECTDDSTWYALKTGVAYNNVPIGRAMPNSWELCVAGAQVGIGYHNREELTKQAFTDCPFVPGARMYHTGDLVRYNEDGEIEFLGRMDNQVKLRGYRIELGEIEAVIVDVGNDNVPCAVLLADARRHHADGASACDENVFTYNVKHEGGMGGVAVSVEEGDYLLGDIPSYGDDVPCGNADVLGKCAVPLDADALCFGTEMALARAAVAALHAGDMALAGNYLTDLKALNALAYLSDLAHVLMTDGHRGLDMGLTPRIPIVNMHIGTADSCFMYLNKHLAMVNLWYGYLHEGKALCGLGLDKRIHHFLHSSKPSFRIKLVVYGEQLFQSGKLDANAKHLHCGGKLITRREAGGYTEVGVVRVVFVRIGGACTRHIDTRLTAELMHALGTAIHNVKGNEVTALGLAPGCDAEGSYLILQRFKHDIELGLEDRGVMLHMLKHAGCGAEELDMP